MTQFERFFAVMKKPWMILSCLLFIVLSYNYLDRPIAIYFHNLDYRNYAHLLTAITAFGRWKYYFLILIILGIFFRFGKKMKSMSKEPGFY